MSKFKIKKTNNNQYHFTLQAQNNEIICQSETYKSKQSALNGIESIKENAPKAEIIDETGEK